MATIPLMGQPVKLPDFNMGDTMVSIARLRAYEQQQQLEALKLGQAQKGFEREDLWRQAWGDVMTPSQPAAGTRGLAGAPPAGGPAVSPLGGVPPMQGASPFTMAQHVPPATAEQGTYANAAMPTAPRTSGMPTEFGTAPIDLQSRTGLENMANRGLAAASPAGMPPPGGGMPPPGPPPGAQGLASKQPGAPDIPGLMLNFNHDALRKAYAIDPEKTMKAYTDQVELHGKKLEQAEKQNTMIYDTLSALEQSPDPKTYYPIALQSLKERGVAIPDSFPKEYDAGMVRFKIREHEGMKERLNNAKINLYGQQQNAAQTQAQENIARRDKAVTENEYISKEFELKRQDKLSEIQRRLDQTQDDTEKRQLEAERNMLDAMKVDQTKGQNIRSAEQNAMAHVDKQMQPYKDVRDAMARIRTGARKTDPASDMALSYAFIKLMDTQTGVRNEEQKDLAHKSGLPGKLREWMGAATGTSQLSSTMRKQILETAERINKATATDYEYQAGQYREIFKNQGLNPNNIIVDYASPKPTRQTQEGARQSTASGGTTGTGTPPTQRAPFDQADFLKWRGTKPGAPTKAEVEEYLKSKGGRAG